MRLTASDQGFLRKKYVAETGLCAADDLFAVLSSQADEPADLDETTLAAATPLRVAVSPVEGSI